MRKARLALGGALLLAAFALISNTAIAAQRYASPAGAGEACTLASPCPIRYAIVANMGTNPVDDGDEVILLPGTYDTGSNEMSMVKAIDVHGQAGQPMPVLNGLSTTGIVRVNNDGATLHHVDVEYGSSATGAYAGLMVTAGTASEV
jgi:hypothetical protein